MEGEREVGASFQGFDGFEISNFGSETQNPNVPITVASNNIPTTVVHEQDNFVTINNIREHDLFVPMANVIRIMRRILPAHAKISNKAKEMVQECVTEFINFITVVASDCCRQELRKIITVEDVLGALSKLGFDPYIDPLELFLKRYQEAKGSQHGVVRREDIMVNKSLAPPTEQDISFFGEGNSLLPLPLSPSQSFQVRSDDQHEIRDMGVEEFFFGMLSGGIGDTGDNYWFGDGSGCSSSN